MGLKSPKIFEYGSLVLKVVLTSGVFNEWPLARGLVIP